MISCAAILAGGAGTRLSSALSGVPKALAPVAGRPFIYYLLDQLSDAGVRMTVLCTGFMSGQIRQALGEWHGEMKLVYSEENSPLGTGGALRLAAPYFNSDTVLVLNGDSFIETDLNHFENQCEDLKIRAGLLLTRTDHPEAGGTVRLEKNGLVHSFDEKIPSGIDSWINAGIYRIGTELIAGLPAGKKISLEHKVLPVWARERKLWGVPSQGRFIDIGTPETFNFAQEFFRDKVSA